MYVTIIVNISMVMTLPLANSCFLLNISDHIMIMGQSTSIKTTTMTDISGRGHAGILVNKLCFVEAKFIILCIPEVKNIKQSNTAPTILRIGSG